MNRKEKRSMSKRLGIMEFQRKLPLNKKLDLIRENIKAGKQKQQELKEELRVSLNKQEEEIESKVIYNLAIDIAKLKHISFEEATIEANEEYMKNKKLKKV